MSFGKVGVLSIFLQHGSHVSILVLMDVVREAVKSVLNAKLKTGFNPCSNGCRSGSQRSYQDVGRMDGVSILVLMDVVREVRHGIGYRLPLG